VFLPVEDEAGMGRFLDDWSAEAGLGAVASWDLQVSGDEASIELETASWAGGVRLRLRAGCEGAPAASATVRRGRELPRDAVRVLAAGFPAPRRSLAEPESEESERHVPFALVGLGVILAAFVAERRSRWARRGALAVVLAGVGAMALLAAWPLFAVPFDCDAGVLRVAYAREDVFGDWNHPFLPYLLNHPATRLSLEPWAVRIVPFLWMAAQLWMLVLLAVRWAGPTAGALAGVWLACEIPRRQSIDQLADWDLAGVFLLGLAAWLAWRERRPASSSASAAETGPAPSAPPASTRETAGLLALMTLGFYSSYMMIVPLGVLVLVLLWDRGTGRYLRWAGAACFGILAVRALVVFRSGSDVTRLVYSARTLVGEMANELPSARVPVMLGVMLAGAGWLALRSVRARPGDPAGRRAPRFLLGVLPAVPAATLLAWYWSHVNHGYYVCLVTPPWLLAGAVALGRLGDRVYDGSVERLRGLGAGRWSGVPGAVVLLAALVGVWGATVSLPAFREDVHFEPSGIEHLAAFDETQRRDPLPIVTDSYHLPLYLAYERGRRGVRPEGPMLPPGGPLDVMPRLRWVDGACGPTVVPGRGGREPWTWDDLGDRFYFVTEAGRRPEGACPADPGVRCDRLYPDRRWMNYFLCRSGAS
jgi:hypothetical protein